MSTAVSSPTSTAASSSFSLEAFPYVELLSIFPYVELSLSLIGCCFLDVIVNREVFVLDIITIRLFVHFIAQSFEQHRFLALD